MSEQAITTEMKLSIERANDMSDKILETCVGESLAAITFIGVNLIIEASSQIDDESERSEGFEATINLLRSKFEMMESERAQL